MGLGINVWRRIELSFERDKEEFPLVKASVVFLKFATACKYQNYRKFLLVTFARNGLGT